MPRRYRVMRPKPGTGAKPRIVILGGRARWAGSWCAICSARVAGRCASLSPTATSLPRRAPVETTQVDVTDPGSLRRALDGAYATIASLPYRCNLEAMRGALEAGAHYVDLGGLFHMTRRQLELAPEFERRGLMAILGMGSAPGIVNVLATLAARGLDAVREIHCLVGGIDRTRYRNMSPLWFGYSADTLLDEFTMPSPVFRAGKFTTVPLSIPASALPSTSRSRRNDPCRHHDPLGGRNPALVVW